MKSSHKTNQFKYEMVKRKEKWKSINEPIEKLLMVPLEAQASVVGELVTHTCYNRLAKMLNLPSIDISHDDDSSVDTIIPYQPPDDGCLSPRDKRSIIPDIKQPSLAVISESITSSQFDDETLSVQDTAKTITEPSLSKTEATATSDLTAASSGFVEIEKRIPYNHELMLKHKAILKFLGLPEAEAATWRVKEAKDVSELSEMTLEEQGDFLINKIAVDFCDWMRALGGDEKSFISEEILKELFQIGMDNPASRAICIKMREKRVLYYKLAEFLEVPKKAFHEVLSQHLAWDARVERRPSKLVAFGKGLPKESRFKTPKNKTAETWLEWNKLSPDQLSFADVYSTVKDLRSTREYCRWLLLHPEHKKPQYLVEDGQFERAISGSEYNIFTPRSRFQSRDTIKRITKRS